MFANPLLGTRVTIIVTPALSPGAVWKRPRFHELSLGMAWRRDGIAKAGQAGREGPEQDELSPGWEPAGRRVLGMGRTPREAARLAAAATPHGELRTAPRTACPADLPPEGAASAAGCPHHRTGRPPRHRETSDFAPDRRGSNASVISLRRSPSQAQRRRGLGQGPPQALAALGFLPCVLPLRGAPLRPGSPSRGQEALFPG